MYYAGNAVAVGVGSFAILVAAALFAIRLVPFVDEEILERTEEKSAKPPAIAVGVPKVFSFEKPDEEFLNQIRRVVRVVSVTPDVGIERIPVGAAKTFQRFSGLRRVLLARLQHDAPVSRVKDAAAAFRAI